MTGPPAMRRQRSLSLTEIGCMTDAPYETVFRWLQLIQAHLAGFGRRPGKHWCFNAHELYVFLMVAAFYKAGIPIGPTQIREIIRFTFDSAGKPKAPKGPLVQACRTTEFVVDAVGIYRDSISAYQDEVHA